MLVFTSFVCVVYQCYCFNHECPHAWVSPTQPTCSAQFCCLYAHEHSHRSRVEGGVESPTVEHVYYAVIKQHFGTVLLDKPEFVYSFRVSDFCFCYGAEIFLELWVVEMCVFPAVYVQPRIYSSQ